MLKSFEIFKKMYLTFLLQQLFLQILKIVFNFQFQKNNNVAEFSKHLLQMQEKVQLLQTKLFLYFVGVFVPFSTSVHLLFHPGSSAVLRSSAHSQPATPSYVLGFSAVSFFKKECITGLNTAFNVLKCRLKIV